MCIHPNILSPSTIPMSFVWSLEISSSWWWRSKKFLTDFFFLATKSQQQQIRKVIRATTTTTDRKRRKRIFLQRTKCRFFHHLVEGWIPPKCASSPSHSSLPTFGGFLARAEWTRVESHHPDPCVRWEATRQKSVENAQKRNRNIPSQIFPKYLTRRLSD